MSDEHSDPKRKLNECKGSEELLPIVYAELRRLASQRLAQEHPGHTLQATALVHEAYLRLADGSEPQQWDSRGHFFAAAAEAMRRILIDSARRKNRIKHGGDRQRLAIDERLLPAKYESDEILAVDEALDAFAKIDPDKAQLVKLRYFAGCTLEESAALLGISPATAKRQWAFARAWLYRKVADNNSTPPRLTKSDE